jgi:flagellar protein FlgJ
VSIPPKSAISAPPSTARANTYSDFGGLAALKKDPSSPQALHAVAQQVDALFLQMMLKSMRDATAESGESASNEMGMYQDMFDKQVALTLSQHGDLGLGAQLTRQLAAQASAASAAGLNPLGAQPPAGAAEPETDPAAAGGNAAPAAAAAADPTEFVSEVYPAIQRAAQSLGVNPLAILAQAALETNWGRQMPRAADGRSSRNLFGIKADEQWGGGRIAADTVEFSNGVATVKRTMFRAYHSVEESVHDFARLLASSPRYRDAVAGGADIRSYFDAIGRSGYATDPQYANKLNGILNSTTFRVAVGQRRVVL